jgi:pyroglutamyl-peptidase
MARRILLTGFGPFSKERVNPSGLAVTKLNGESVLGVKIVGVELPVVFREAGNVLIEKIDEVKPIAIISSGVAAGRPEINVERVAINVMDTHDTPDNKGVKPKDEPIVKDGPAAYFTTLPFRRIVKDFAKEGIPAVVSNTAGTHLCNYAMYMGRHYTETKNLRIPSGFIHVPQTPDQTLSRRGMPSMSLDVITEALRVATRGTIRSVAV